MGLGLDNLVTCIVQVTTMRLGDGEEESKWLSHVLMALCVFGIWMVCLWYGIVDFARSYRIQGGRGRNNLRRAREIAMLVIGMATVFSIMQLVRVIHNQTIFLKGYLLTHQIMQLLIGALLTSIYTGALKSRWLYMVDGLNDLRKNFSDEIPLLPIHNSSPTSTVPAAPPAPLPIPSSEPSYGPIRFAKKWRGDKRHPYLCQRPLLVSSLEEHPPTPSTTCYSFPTPAWLEKMA